MITLSRLLRGSFDRVQRVRMSGADYARWKGVSVGRNSQILTQDFGGEPFLIAIGDDCLISNGVFFLNHDGAVHSATDDRGPRQAIRRIHIGNRVYIGLRVIILPGVKIGDDVIIGAGSVVNRSVPPGWIVAGNPARQVGLTEQYRRRARNSFAIGRPPANSKSYRDWVESIVTNEWAKEMESTKVPEVDH